MEVCKLFIYRLFSPIAIRTPYWPQPRTDGPNDRYVPRLATVRYTWQYHFLLLYYFALHEYRYWTTGLNHLNQNYMYTVFLFQRTLRVTGEPNKVPFCWQYIWVTFQSAINYIYKIKILPLRRIHFSNGTQENNCQSFTINFHQHPNI